MKKIAIIPARSGSKGLKDKNIKLLNGKPLIAYTIEAALQSGIFDIVHVSTDSEEYACIARKYGADVPFLRNADNAGDSSSSWDVVREVLTKYESIGETFDVCVLLQPTSPMRNSVDILEAYKLFNEKNAKSLSSVTEVEHPVQWCFRLNEMCSMEEFSKSPYKDSRRQELEKNYRENGAIYIVRTGDICNHEFEFYTSECFAYIMDKNRSVDIDTIQDFLIAEVLMGMEAQNNELE